MQNDWWTALAERTQRYADMSDTRVFYEALEALHFSDESTLLTDKEAILQCWSVHLEGLFSDQPTVLESSLAKIPQVDVNLELHDPPTCEDTIKATMQLKVCTSSGIDGIQQKSISMGEKQ